jgi:outer membrane receptor protein involved in Fe transport
LHIANILKYTASVAVLAAFAGSANAQEANRQVDEIVVTAQKREQSLQNVPIVVTALPQKLLQDAGVKDIKDLTILTPGLMVTSTSNETVTTARIRGIGTVGDNPGLESSVGVVVDGVYRPRNGVGFGDLGELERVEVLKGPQGTLFGKNTSAGVINILSAAPKFNFGANGELTVGNYGAIGGSASVTGPIIADKLAGRLFVAKRQRDGFYDVRTVNGPRTNNEDANQDFYSVRGQLLATPTSDLDFRVIADFTKRDENCCAAVQVVRAAGVQGLFNTLTGGVATTLNPVDPGSRMTYSNRDTTQKIEDKGVSVEANWATPWLGGAKLTSITAWRNWKTINGQDSDFSGADIWYRPDNGVNYTEFDQLSQEIRLAGQADKLNWLVGAFATQEKLNGGTYLLYGNSYRSFIGALAGAALPTSFYVAGTGQGDDHAQEAKGIALFTNNAYAVSDKLELTMGLRYTNEEKTLNSQYRNSGTGGVCFAAALCFPWTDPAFNKKDVNQSRTESEWSGTVKATYRLSPSVMTYASYARGYKAGGFNLDRARTRLTTAGVPTPTAPFYAVNSDTSFGGEFVDSFELGTKSSLFDRSVLFNASLFHQTFTDFQLNAFTGVSFIVTSVPEVVSRGLDTDFVWFTPVDGLNVQGGVTYAETQYGSFTVPAGASPRLPNTRVSFAPLYSGSLSASYERSIGSGLEARASLSAKYTSSYNTGSDLNPLKVQPGLTVLNGRIAVGSEDNRWTAELWAQNLTDENYYQVVFDAPLQTGALNAFMGAPRTYGATIRVKY